MDAHEIPSAQRLFEWYVLDPCLLFGQAARVPQIVDLLNRFHECVILIRGVVTQHVHVEAHALLDERKSDATGANHRDRFAGDFVPEKWQVRMPISPLQIAGEM